MNWVTSLMARPSSGSLQRPGRRSSPPRDGDNTGDSRSGLSTSTLLSLSSRLNPKFAPIFSSKFGSGSSIGSGSNKSDDWFVTALNWSNGGMSLNSNSSSVNCLLGLNDNVLVGNDAKVESGGVNKNQDVHSVPASLDKTVSCESVSSTPNLPPIKVEDQLQNIGVDEQFGQLGLNGNGNHKVDDGGVAALSSPSAGPNVAAVVVPVTMSYGQGGGDSVSGDEKSEQLGVLCQL